MLLTKGEQKAFHSFGRVLLQVVAPSLSLHLRFIAPSCLVHEAGYGLCPPQEPPQAWCVLTCWAGLLWFPVRPTHRCAVGPGLMNEVVAL